MESTAVPEATDIGTDSFGKQSRDVFHNASIRCCTEQHRIQQHPPASGRGKQGEIWLPKDSNHFRTFVCI